MTAVVNAPEDVFRAIANRLIERVRKYEQRRDSRCVFAYCYSLMTLQIARLLPSEEFDDRAWIVSLATAFSEDYVAALDAFDEGRPETLSPAWKAVFDAAGR